MRAAIVGLALGVIQFAAMAQDDLGPKVIAITPQMKAVATAALKGCKPAGSRLVGKVNRNNVYTLTGDFFGNGNIYAILDRDPILICEWTHGRWKLMTALDTNAVWKYAGWDMDIAWTREPDAVRPFWRLKLQGHPLLVIAGYPEKEGQNYSIIWFDEALRIFDTSDSFNMSPVVRGNYLITGDASRGKAEMSGIYYSRIVNGKFKTLHNWEEDCPWHQNDEMEQWWSIDVGESTFIVTQNYEDSSNDDSFLVFKIDPKKTDWGVGSWKTEQRFAKVSFKLKRNNADNSFESAEKAYFFGKLTGLPRNLFYSERIDWVGHSEPSERVETKAAVHIDGGPESTKLFSR